MLNKLIACKEQAQHYYQIQDMNELEQVMRQWQQLLQEAQEHSGDREFELYLKLSEMWFEQLNGALYEGASMIREGLECYEKAGELSYQAFCLVEEKLDEEASAEAGCECVEMSYILYQTYMKSLETGKAAGVIRTARWMLEQLKPFLCQNLTLGTLVGELLFDLSSTQTTCGDVTGAMLTLNDAETVYHGLSNFRKTISSGDSNEGTSAESYVADADTNEAD